MVKKATTRRPIVFQSGEDQLFGMLHHPGGKKAVPAVIIIHGFASNKIGTNRSWVHLAEGLCEVGIATLRFDQRGFGDSEGDCSQLALSDLVDDVMAAIAAVQEIEEIDSDHVALFGSSLGGALAVQAAARSQKIRALALWAPVATGALSIADICTASPQVATSSFLSTYRGVPLSKQFQEQFKQFSVIEALHALHHVPLLHMHGADDKVVSLQHQKVYQEVRKNAVADSIFIIHPETEHFLGNAAICKTALTTYINWFSEKI